MNDVMIVIPISRDRFFEQFFAMLEKLECNRLRTQILFYVDGDYRLFSKTQQRSNKLTFPFKQVIYRNKGIPNTGSVKRRRQRIADIHNEIKQRVPACDYVFLVEDDTLLPPNALQKLLENFEYHPGVLFHSGIELGRWGFPIIGAWKKIERKIVSLPWEGDLTASTWYANAAGFYCFLVKRESYINHEFKPFDTILGPDVEFGMSHHYLGMVDFSIQCAHLNPKATLTFDKVKPIQMEFIKDESCKDGWRQNIIQ